MAFSAELIKNKPAGPKKTPIWEGVDDEALLAHLPRVEAIRHQIDDDLRGWVGSSSTGGHLEPNW